MSAEEKLNKNEESAHQHIQPLFQGLNRPKPFLKWAGGKTQLISEIEKRLPVLVKSGKFTYIEPFIGSGAVFFWMLNNCPNIKRAVINDVNFDLINTFQTIKREPETLIEILRKYEIEFHALQKNEDEKKANYYAKRDLYNARNEKKQHSGGTFYSIIMCQF